MKTSRELNAADIWGAFERAYLGGGPLRASATMRKPAPPNGDRIFAGKLAIVDGTERSVSGPRQWPDLVGRRRCLPNRAS